MSFSAAFAQVFRSIASNFALASIIVLAVILYGFYYPAPYAHQTARQLPVVVVDEEQTPVTRQLIRNLSDAREVRIAAEAPSVAAAEQMVRAREADGILLLPRGLTRSLLTGARGGGMGLWLNGTYLVRARDIGGAIQAHSAPIRAPHTVSATTTIIAADRRERRGRLVTAARPDRLSPLVRAGSIAPTSRRDAPAPPCAGRTRRSIAAAPDLTAPQVGPHRPPAIRCRCRRRPHLTAPAVPRPSSATGWH